MVVVSWLISLSLANVSRLLELVYIELSIIELVEEPIFGKFSQSRMDSESFFCGGVLRQFHEGSVQAHG